MVIQMKAFEQFFPVVPSIMLYNVILSGFDGDILQDEISDFSSILKVSIFMRVRAK